MFFSPLKFSALGLQRTFFGTVQRNLKWQALIFHFLAGKAESLLNSWAAVPWTEEEINSLALSLILYSPLSKRKENWAKLTFAKTSGTVTGDKEDKLANSWLARPQ